MAGATPSGVSRLAPVSSAECVTFREKLKTEAILKKFALIDNNGDGTATPAEIEAASAREFAELKTAGKIGATTAAELLALHKTAVGKIDANGDGQITQAEFLAWHRTGKF